MVSISLGYYRDNKKRILSLEHVSDASQMHVKCLLTKINTSSCSILHERMHESLPVIFGELGEGCVCRHGILLIHCHPLLRVDCCCDRLFGTWHNWTLINKISLIWEKITKNHSLKLVTVWLSDGWIILYLNWFPVFYWHENKCSKRNMLKNQTFLFYLFLLINIWSKVKCFIWRQNNIWLERLVRVVKVWSPLFCFQTVPVP